MCNNACLWYQYNYTLSNLLFLLRLTHWIIFWCGYCYSCHWKKEKLEKARLEPLIVSNSAFLEKYPQPAIIEQPDRQLITLQQQHQQQQTRIIDVYGQQTEPICNYHTCHHKFSLH